MTPKGHMAVVEENDALAVCRAFLTRVPFAGAAFTLQHPDGAHETLCASDETITRVTSLQYSLGEGPALLATLADRPILVPDVASVESARRWPLLVAALTGSPVRALFCLPMRVGARMVGVCDGYRTRVGTLTTDGLCDALRANRVATVSLLGRRRRPD